MRERSSGSDSLESEGSTLGGSPASFCSQCEGSSNAGRMYSEATPSFCAVDSGEALGVVDTGLARFLDGGDQIGILPDRHAVLAPVQSERPARQAFAGIPFALPVMQQAARREARAQFADEIVGQTALGRTDRGDVPFRRFQVVDRNKGRLAAHGQADVARPEIGIDLFSERVEPRPGLVGERPGDPRRFADPLDVHLEAEFDIRQIRPRPRSAPPSGNAAWRRRGYAPRRSACPR